MGCNMQQSQTEAQAGRSDVAALAAIFWDAWQFPFADDNENSLQRTF
jgi:hypothetical protein